MIRMAFYVAAALLATAPSALMAAPAEVAAAVAAPSRTAENVKLDESRKPAALLQFFGLKEGDHVIDMFGANRYWAEIMAPAVGPHGSVTVWQPTQFMNDKRKAEFAQFAARQPNVALISTPFQAPQLGHDAYDFMIKNLDYHETYWQNPKAGIPQMDPNQWLKAVYDAMKPGATVGIVDHIANPGGDTRETVEKLHRIDPAVIKADFERAGFVLEEQSDLLRNPADDPSLLVFDPKIRGNTDRAVFRFRKPA
jgi:predicted methyltransferase